MWQFTRVGQARIDSQFSNSDFLQRFDFSKVVIGTSIKPEHFTAEEYQQQLHLQTAKFAVEQLGMREIRVGIRWNRIEVGEQLTLDYYRQILDYLFAQNLPICLNLGPIKSIGWPEEHAPQSILDKLKFKTEVDLSSEIAKLAGEYLDQLVNLLIKEYGSTIGSTQIIQGDNEPFFQFGEKQWTFTSNYILNQLTYLHQRFPQHKLLISTSGRKNSHQILPLFEQVPDASFILGYNYYYKVPEMERLPIMRKLDNLFTLTPWHLHMRQVQERARANGFAIEVSEAQAEPWTTVTSPGNSAQEFRFVLLRCLREILEPQATKSVIRYWGIEELAKKYLRNQLTAEHHQIIELIQHLNS